LGDYIGEQLLAINFVLEMLRLVYLGVAMDECKVQEFEMQHFLAFILLPAIYKLN
jgi:hypothetical protein